MSNVVSWKPILLGASFLLYRASVAFATEKDHLYPTPSTGFMSVQQDGRQVNCHIVDKSGPIVGANVVVKGLLSEIFPIWTDGLLSRMCPPTQF